MVLVSTFLANLLCSISTFCWPTYEPPKIPDNEVASKIGFRSSLFNASNEPWTEYPIVSTVAGDLRGFTMYTIGKRKIHAFEGIPFAEPPVGNLRFRSPVKKKRWSGILNTMNGKSNCLQLDLSRIYQITGSEDCLHLNLYSPQAPGNNSYLGDGDYPVMIWFYGGAFLFGSKDQYGPAYILETDVILVTVNYRLGVFGFLSTGDEAAPGNWGLKDQNMAIRWVNENIKMFGGDPTRITLFGQSAGGASVHMHMMSHQSRGLFHYGITQSASAFSPWAIIKDVPVKTIRLARSLSCPTNNSHQMVDCLRTRNHLAVTSAQFRLYEYMNFPIVNFGPVIEPEGPDAFLTKTPQEHYQSGDIAKIPWVAGFVRDEGNVYNILMVINPMAYFIYDRNFDRLAPLTMEFRGLGLNETAVARKIRKFYLGNEPLSYRTLKGFSDMHGDRAFLPSIYYGLKAHSHYAPTYGYYLNYYGKAGILERIGMKREEAGIAHYDDVAYLLNSSTLHRSIDFGERDFSFSEFLVDLWTNFAATGEPLHTDELGDKMHFWPPIKPNKATLKLAELNEKPKIIEYPKMFLERINFWVSLGVIKPFDVKPNVNETSTSQ